MNTKSEFQKKLLLKEKRIDFWELNHKLLPKEEELFFNTFYNAKIGEI